MKTRWFHILLAISEQPVHGSEIVRGVLGQTQGATRLWPAMLYGTLEQMVEAGLIRELAKNPAGESAKRRYYEITAAGKKALRKEADHLAKLASLARSRVGG